MTFTGGNNATYNYRDYKTFKEFFRDIYYTNTSINEVERKQNEFDAMLNVLIRYPPRDEKHIVVKNELLDGAKDFYEGREKIIEGFQNGIFPLIKEDFHNDGQRPDSSVTSDSSIN